MPRLLPRLIRAIQLQRPTHNPPFDIRNHRQRTPKSLYSPTSPSPSFNPDAHPQSILLAPENPIATPDRYTRHKTLPPRIHVPKDASGRDGEYDKPRQMTQEERKWWSSPYLRMLATPPRKCALSDRLFPSAFLVRLAPVRISDVEPTSPRAPIPCILIPDGLQHPKFTSRRSNRAVHVVCSRQAISIIENQRVSNVPHYVAISRNLAVHVSHLLRLRVLQELDLLVAQLGVKPKADVLANPPIRLLSSSEWEEIQESKEIPWQDAVAVINVPPIIRDTETGTETEPSMSPFPLAPDTNTATDISQVVAAMHPVSRDSSFPTNFQYRDVLPSAKVPLYNGLALFPQAAQRAALHKLLGQIQSIYNGARRANGLPELQSNVSNTYLLRSNSEIIKLGDMAAVAMALWRVHLYERDILRETKVDSS